MPSIHLANRSVAPSFTFLWEGTEWPRHYRYSQAPCTVTSASATYHTVKDGLNLNNVVFYYQKDTKNVLHSLCLLSYETVDACDLGDHKIYLSSVNFSHFWELPLSHVTYFAC